MTHAEERAKRRDERTDFEARIVSEAMAAGRSPEQAQLVVDELRPLRPVNAFATWRRRRNLEALGTPQAEVDAIIARYVTKAGSQRVTR